MIKMVLFEYGDYTSEYEKPDNLVEIFENSAKKFANKPFIGEKDKNGVYQWVTYGYIKQRADNLRGGLAKIGIKKGDMVGIIANNRKEWFICENATHGLGAVFVPMYEKELLTMWHYIVKDAEIKILFVAREDIYEKVKHFKSEIPTLKEIYIIEKEGKGSMAELEELGKQNPIPPIFPAPTDWANILYTSGTTGEPKGVILSHGNQTANMHSGLKWFKTLLNANSRSIAMLPWAHSFGITVELHAFMSQGAQLGLLGSVETILEDFLKVQPTFLVTVPRVFNKVYNGVWALMRKEGGTKLKLFEEAVRLAKLKRETGKSSFKLKILDKLVFGKIRKKFGGRMIGAMTGSAPMNIEVANFFFDIKIPVYDCYGLTESSPGITMNSPEAGWKLGTVGRPMPGTKIIIDRSRTGEDYQDGEILAFGPQIMVGYHKKPDKTKEVIVEMNGMRGLRTGDKGWLDDDGYLHISGRFKEEYKLENGKYVHPEAIQNEMKLIPYVLNSFIYGEGKPYNVALVVLDKNPIKDFIKNVKLSVTYEELFDDKNPASKEVKELLALDIQNHLRKTFGGYEIPRKFVFIDEDFSLDSGTMTQTMKLKRQKIMEKYGERLLALYK